MARLSQIVALAVAGLGCIGPALSPALSQEWPIRPTTMVVPFSAGGPADTVARILAPRVAEFLGQQVVIENVGGSGGHLACLLLNSAIGINVTHVPYRGATPAMQDLIAGRIDYQCPDTPIAIPQIESKNVKAIAILTRGRTPSLPDQACAHEQGL